MTNKETVELLKKLSNQNEEKEKRAAELVIANKELKFQNEEKEKRAAELVIANKELKFQNEEKDKRAAELVTAKELLHEANSNLKEALSYTRDLLEINPNPLVIIAPNGLMTDVNAAMEMATGFSRNQLINKEFCTFFTDPKQAKIGYQEAFKAGKIIDFELRLKNINGTSVPVLYNASVYKNKEGQVIGLFAAAKDISALRKAQDELEKLNENLELLVEKRTMQLNETTKYYERVFNKIPDAAVITRLSDGKILSVNDSFEYFFGYTQEEIVGQTQPEINLYQGSNDRINIVKELNESGFCINREVGFKRKDGSGFTGLLSATTIMKEDVLCVSSYIRDITERIFQRQKIRELNNQLENRVIERTAQLDSANKELEAFSYSVSHDLKAPVRHITGFASLLEKKYAYLIPEEGRQYLDNVLSSAEHMGELIDGLLLFSRAGRIEMNQTLLNMNEIVDALIQPIIEMDKDHRIKFEVANLPSAYGDQEMLKSVWSNLIENAVKFSKNKAIAEIRIGFEETTTEITYYIEDNGAGFDMAYIAKLFNVFQRVHAQNEFEGTGIGLATIRRIITKHGGKTWAEGHVGSGAKFYFTLLKRKERMSI